MAEQPAGTLIRLADSTLALADPDDDVRGRKVIDTTGEELGKIEGLVIDEDERRVRFLEIASGGILGLGEQHRLIPVEAVTRVADDSVMIARDRDHLAGGPGYDPAVVPERPYYEGVYEHWGFPPFWSVGGPYPPWRQ